MRSRNFIFLFFLCIFILCLVVIFGYLFFTTNGSSFVTKLVLSRYTESKNIDVKKIDGRLSEKLFFRDIEIKDLEGLPKGSVIRIQKLEVDFTSFSLEGLNIDIENGRLRLPLSEPVLFYGSYKDGSLDINVYSKQVSVNDFLDLSVETKTLGKVSGTISDVDIYVEGSFFKPMLRGEFLIDKLLRNGFSLTNCPGIFAVILDDIKSELKVIGDLTLKSAKLSGAKTAIITLQQSKIIFSGNPKKPSLDIKGNSIVEGAKINIVLKGTIDKPDLKLTSEPSMPQGRLLVMLVTGKSWKSTEQLGKGEIPVDLARDFVDYLLFGGAGSKIAQRFGISDVSVKYDAKTKGVGIQKDVTDKAKIKYGVEQTQTETKTNNVNHKVGGSYKITDEIEVEGEKGIKKSKNGQTEEDTKTNDKISVKYKKEF